MLEIAATRDIKKIYAYVLSDNGRMLAMMKKRGFTVTKSDDSVRVERVMKS
jgi:hypothetical protein